MTLDKKNHYSYTVYADRDLAESFHASRFGGPIGELLARNQEKVLLGFLGPVENKKMIKKTSDLIKWSSNPDV